MRKMFLICFSIQSTFFTLFKFLDFEMPNIHLSIKQVRAFVKLRIGLLIDHKTTTFLATMTKKM